MVVLFSSYLCSLIFVGRVVLFFFGLVAAFPAVQFGVISPSLSFSFLLLSKTPLTTSFYVQSGDSPLTTH